MSEAPTQQPLSSAGRRARRFAALLRPASLAEWLPKPPWRRYLAAALLVALAGLTAAVVRPFLAPANLVMVFLLVVILAALDLGRGPAALTALLSVLVFDFFFVPPLRTLAVTQLEYLAMLGGLLIVGLLTSSLATRLLEQAEATRSRERETAALYALSRDLSAAGDLAEVTRALRVNGVETLGRELVILLPSDLGSEQAGTPDSSGPYHEKLDAENLAAAVWAFEHGQPAGRGASFEAGATLRFLPLITARGKVGVLGIGPAEIDDRLLTAQQRRLAEAFAHLAAQAVDRVRLAEAAGQVQLLKTTEKLQTALLHSISHELRTPLVTITGALTTLQEKNPPIDEASRSILVDAAVEEAEHLNRLVGNLLEMTRLEAGAVRVRSEAGDLEEVVGAALDQVGRRLGDRPIEVDIPAELPRVPMDLALIVHSLVNVVDNALKYSPPASPIRIRARAGASEISIEVADRGSGIPEEELGRVFEGFHRVQRLEGVGGTGLGLAIARGLVEAHGGRIWAENRAGGGTAITLALPLVAPTGPASMPAKP
ncbi:MAG TPA: DUF4118 domain-containing protein [Anaerolineae bacterium]|nr:DUF4118 domain-containing protein [Anaerolineae bacterium]